MKRNKKYNPLKQLNLVAKHALKNAAIGYVTGGVDCHLIDLRNHKINVASYTTAKMIYDLRHRWCVFIAVFGIDSDNKRYMKSKEITVDYPCYQTELVDVLNEEHTVLGKNFNQKHLIGYGWIATPSPKDWRESEAFEILTSLGAFEYKIINEGVTTAVYRREDFDG